MGNIVMILGRSGSGKSTSIKTLNPKETVILNVLGKRLPFKGSQSLYNIENKNLFQVSTHSDLVNYIKNISGNASHVKNIVIDDMIYSMRKEYFTRAKEVGFNKYVELAQHFQQIIEAGERAREDLNVFLILHSEDVVSDNVVIGKKVSTVGKLIDNTYNPAEVVPMVLYAEPQFDEKGMPKFGFYTHTSMQGTVLIPAKTPEGMFEEDFIPNDLQLVVNKMNEYYG